MHDALRRRHFLETKLKYAVNMHHRDKHIKQRIRPSTFDNLYVLTSTLYIDSQEQEKNKLFVLPR